MGGLSEIRHRKLSPPGTCDIIVGAGGFLGGVVCADQRAVVVDGSLRSPRFLVPTVENNAAKPRGLALSSWGVGHVLGVGGESHVATTAVQAVVVSMVNLDSGGRVHDEAMQVYISALVLPVCVPPVPVPTRSPLVRQDTLSVFGVNDGDLALGQGDENGAIIAVHPALLTLGAWRSVGPLPVGRFRVPEVYQFPSNQEENT